MTLVVLAGLPVIALANRIQQNEADATVEPEGIEAVCVFFSDLTLRRFEKKIGMTNSCEFT